MHNNLNSARVEYFVDDFPPFSEWIVFGIECIHAEQSDVKQKMITLGIKLMLEKKNQLRSNSVIYQNNSISDIYIEVWIIFLLTVLSELSQQFYMPLI